jgi:hypothetical protein
MSLFSLVTVHSLTGRDRRRRKDASMQWVRDQFTERRTALTVVSLYAIIVGALTFLIDIGAVLDGSAPAMSRAVLGLVGIAGGVFAWTFRQSPVSGWHILMLWAIVQIPVFAWSIDGSPTLQIISLPLSATSTTTINGVVTSHSEVGVNIVGIILAGVLSRQRAAFASKRPAQPAVQPG